MTSPHRAAPRLPRGGKVASFSPSSPISATVPVRYERGRAFLAANGYDVLDGALTGRSDFYRSGTVRERADELNALLRDPSVDCIMSTIGGANSNSLLPYLDYDAFAAHPKVVVGYSDATAILLALYARTGITTYYGPAVAASLGEFPPLSDETFAHFLDVAGHDAERPLTLSAPAAWTEERLLWDTQDRAKATRPNAWRTLRGGVARGRLVGGNLNTMSVLIGTPYMPAIEDGDILFVEDSLKEAATQERLFAMLKSMGVFARIGGLVVGKHELFDDLGTGRSPVDILTEVLDGEGDFPILVDVDCGHTHPMLTLPIGATAELDADAQVIRLLD